MDILENSVSRFDGAALPGDLAASSKLSPYLSENASGSRALERLALRAGSSSRLFLGDFAGVMPAFDASASTFSSSESFLDLFPAAR